MPEPQPGADRPVDGNLSDSPREGEPAVTQEQPSSPVPPTGGPRAGLDGTHETPTEPREAADQATRQADAGEGDDAGTTAKAEQRPAPAAEVGPQGTRVLPDPAAEEAPAPRWSGS
ncbi:hypothetical protein C1I95_16495, partial [Micromonospora craterilacus]